MDRQEVSRRQSICSATIARISSRLKRTTAGLQAAGPAMRLAAAVAIGMRRGGETVFRFLVVSFCIFCIGFLSGGPQIGPAAIISWEESSGCKGKLKARVESRCPMRAFKRRSPWSASRIKPDTEPIDDYALCPFQDAAGRNDTTERPAAC
ncbi:hypothetical protein [Ciceribacter sp. RN22]|uniref:hypothetical protein n=1 Tax=Ciceribacter sp. RN22 TaxID=2954932 RepID=UPI00209286F5|nr:hypothetical protein [Ciceribacter sp. RN22]MCO6177412.1 hypothetical protein [Ciceribacter sp. RN22]